MTKVEKMLWRLAPEIVGIQWLVTCEKPWAFVRCGEADCRCYRRRCTQKERDFQIKTQQLIKKQLHHYRLIIF